MSYKCYSTFKFKNSWTLKMGTLTLLTSKECKDRIRKVKKACDICGKPLGRVEKPQWGKDKISFTL